MKIQDDQVKEEKESDKKIKELVQNSNWSHIDEKGCMCWKPEDFKDFISSLLSAERKEMETRISQLRQWLNEDRITDPKKMVRDEELKTWLIQNHE